MDYGGNPMQLRYAASYIERTEAAIERVEFCYDVFLNFTEHGEPGTADMDADKALGQLKEALDVLLQRAL